MTLKEKVQQVNPEHINAKVYGGVMGCPDNFAYLNCNREEIINRCENGMNCKECWEQEYTELETDTVLPVWQQNIINKFMQVI